MVVNFRLLVTAVAAFGLGVGLAFGIGVAYGRGDPKTVNTGLSQQQISSLLSGTGAGGGSQTNGAASAGNGARGGGFGAGGGLFGNNTIGEVTAIDGDTITVQTAQGSVKVTLPSSARVSSYSSGNGSISVGDPVVVSGTKGSDGSVEATSVSQLPQELAALATAGGGNGGAGRANRSATPTP